MKYTLLSSLISRERADDPERIFNTGQQKPKHTVIHMRTRGPAYVTTVPISPF